MTAVTVKRFLENVQGYIDAAAIFEDEIIIATDKGNAMLVNEDIYRSMKESINMMRDHELMRNLEKAKKMPV